MRLALVSFSVKRGHGQSVIALVTAVQTPTPRLGQILPGQRKDHLGVARFLGIRDPDVVVLDRCLSQH
ncbi:hypothetical protein EJ571_11490 [Mycobacteroides franklinii]|uniref:Uncharacterized protein n=1 Tax=Mycobacteroides franklinii TaxID=948102 RepID=A0A4R5PCL7_9MYCO|nr:hypothetical protein EJ571_11490 [Mycobacteroides franklinii]